MQYPPNQNRQGQPLPYQQPIYPGQFRPPPYPPRPPYTPPPSGYNGWFLAALVIIYLLSLLFVFIEIVIGSSVPTSTEASSSSPDILGSAAVVLLIVLHGVIIMKDGQNFITLFGKLQWRGMKGWLKVVLVLVYFCMWIMSGIYLVQATNHFLRTRQQTLGQAISNGWISYKAKTQRAQLAIGISIALLLIAGITFTSFGAMVDRANMPTMLTPTVTTSQAATSANGVTPTPAQNLVVTTVATTAPTVTPLSTPTTKPAPSPTPVPTRRVVPTPTPRPKPTPTPKPTQSPQLFITFTCASAVDYSYGQVCVHTLPGAALTITVTYCTGYSAVSRSLKGTFYADGNGNEEWTWTPETKCHGPATATVSASWNGQSVSNSDGFNVR